MTSTEEPKSQYLLRAVRSPRSGSGPYFTVTVTHFEVLPALSTTRTHSFDLVVFTFTVREVAFGLDVGTSVIWPPVDVFTCTLPMPEFLSLALTVSFAAPLAAAGRTADAETFEEDGAVLVPDAPLMVGAVVSRMMSSWYGVDGEPKRLMNFT